MIVSGCPRAFRFASTPRVSSASRHIQRTFLFLVSFLHHFLSFLFFVFFFFLLAWQRYETSIARMEIYYCVLSRLNSIERIFTYLDLKFIEDRFRFLEI